MHIFARKKSLYEEIEPGQFRNKHPNLFKYATVLIFGVTIGAVVLTAFVSNRGSSGIPISLLPDAAVVANLGAAAPTVASESEDILVELDKGQVRGFKMNSRRGREFLAFRGIPYAQAPVGKLRFQPPVELEPWEGILNATEFGAECLQRSKSSVKGSEDCLFVNVYTPKKFAELGKRKYLPVMVYVHGGVAGGSAERNTGEYFMDQDVVLVGFNYRVGVLGNLNTNDSLARGNQGNRDQILALQWVKSNIRKFGGDKKKVTLFGNSYGAMAIANHLLSPMAEGLFHQFICQSGQAIFPDLLQRNPLKYAIGLGKELQCNTTTTTELVNCLQSLNAEAVINGSKAIRSVDGGNAMSTSTLNPFTLTVDPFIEGVSADDVYLPETPIKLIQSGQTKRMPAIIGVNSGEGLAQSAIILSSPQITKLINDNWETMAPLSMNLSSPAGQEFVRAASDFYFDGKNISEEIRQNLTDLFSDRLGIHPAHVSAFYQKQVNRRRENVYMYYFTKEVEGSYLRAEFAGMTEEERGELGPAHADELQFLFPYPPFPLVPLGSKDSNFSEMMVRIWAEFAKSGKPGLGDNNTEWLPINEKPYDYFQLDVEPKMVNFLGERMDFWDSFNLDDLYG